MRLYVNDTQFPRWFRLGDQKGTQLPARVTSVAPCSVTVSVCRDSHIRVAATGSVDEANAFSGLATGLTIGPLRLQETQVAWLEAHIDEPMGRPGR